MKRLSLAAAALYRTSTLEPTQARTELEFDVEVAIVSITKGMKVEKKVGEGEGWDAVRGCMA